MNRILRITHSAYPAAGTIPDKSTLALSRDPRTVAGGGEAHARGKAASACRASSFGDAVSPVTSPTPHPAAINGAVTRAMIAQDAFMISDVMLSAQHDSEVGGIVPLVTLGHAARIAYEGSRVLRSPDPQLGIPQLAAILNSGHSDTIERARHATKLLDDTKKTTADLIAAMDSYGEAHAREYLDSVVWFARGLGRDLGLYLLDGQVLGATVPLQYRFGVPSSVPISEVGKLLYEVAQSLGGTLWVLAASNLQEPQLQATVDFAALKPMTMKDVLAKKYLAGAYDPGLTHGAKLLLLMIEGEAASALHALQPAAPSHRDAVFRARLISVVHAVRGLAVIAALTTPPAHVTTFLHTPSATLFLQDGDIQALRNVCMHYGIRLKQYQPSANPLFGLVEVIAPSWTFDALEATVIGTLRDAVETLATWRKP